MQKLKVFISSVQGEFAKERELLYEHFKTNALLSNFFEPVIFEKLPAASQAPNKVYINEVENAQLYMVLLGHDYGFEDPEGISPTEREYDHARAHHLDCIAFIKGPGSLQRHDKESNFIRRVQQDLSYKRFEMPDDLIRKVDHACFALLQHKGMIQLTTFDESLHPTATIDDLSAEKIEQFIGLAQAKRGFPLRPGTATERVLAHLNLLQGGKLYNGALLAFADNPQQFFTQAVTKCAHFHGVTAIKPIPDHRVWKGDVFEQVDQAVDFVLSKISVSVGTREESNQAPIQYEIPRAVVAEAIVNAIAHREYTSNGSVQVMLFADRLEVSNPGGLTPELSIAKLKTDHASYPTNPKLAEVMYQAGYIERFGTGTEEIYRLSADTGLREPEFDLEEGFKVIIWRPSVQVTDQVPYKYHASTMQVPGKYRASREIDRVLLVLDGEMKRADIQELLELKNRDSFMENYLQPAMAEGLVEMTIPEKPNSSKQSYRLTTQGLQLQKAIRENDK
jgi:ATP-dependent DNA helicase RecG